MDLKSGTLLVPPAVKNSSCSHPRYTSHNFLQHVGIAETIEAVLILILTLGVIGANALVIFVINNRRYSPYIHQQPRYLLTSLALNDLTIGLLITPFGLLPALFHCWPYGEIFCQIQGLLRGALSQQSAVILICMAVDRYMCSLHPRRYYQHSSKKGCVAVLSLTWIISLTIFGFLVLPKGYYFNNTGLMACEPFYSKASYRILATCGFYFPTTMVLMYCYGSSFHMSRFTLNDPTMPLTSAIQHPAYQQQFYHPYHSHLHMMQQHHQQQQQQLQQQQQQQQLHHQQQQQQHHQLKRGDSTGSGPGGGGGSIGGASMGMTASMDGGPMGCVSTPTTMLPQTPIMNLGMAMGMGLNFAGNTITKKIAPPTREKKSSGATSRSMAAISLGFIVMVTPWTIQEIVATCTGSKLPPFLDFVVTWTALSNSFWNPFIYWLLNDDFRRVSKKLMMPLRCKRQEDTPESKSPCCHINSDLEITTLPMPPEPPTSRPPQNSSGNNGGGGGGGGSGKGHLSLSSMKGGSVLGICARGRSNSLNRSFHIKNAGLHSHHTHMRPDIEGLSEKYWGEILERTVSSNSLHAAMQKSYAPTATHLYHPHAYHPPTANVGNTMTTSFSKHSDLNLHISEQDDVLVDAGNTNMMMTTPGTGSDLNKFSTSEPKLFDAEEDEYGHEAQCAKTKANTEANRSLGAMVDTAATANNGRGNQPDI
ncbi:dopamine receptor 2 [Stomoxys calcitrans]|uniref:dopamine receptor 2 n=1 Tax=Stomoxys calcitrans TaxID=35570 RepID=UPI0027E230CA|nr:dopamine receptor 2 [Stomoxys calcitrans]XP_059225307.1 dopamine receptor 2 [Stomoxys calcitrans]XP_059225308.1 dopamine receptor 2 [Stomoxys calcitrans]XP_059225309.1 dopamine receptor 2 [Stomoxys calcitrans]